jgi:hypothetical protein
MNKENQYVYILVRKDLSREQVCVQSCHAALEASRHFINPQEHHPSIVILQVANEDELNVASKHLTENGIRFKEFRESYYQNSLTAIATEMISGPQRAHLKGYSLLTFRENATC